MLTAISFPLIFVGVGASYDALAGWLNRSHVVANKQLIGIQHRPLPWFGNRDIEASDLKQGGSSSKCNW